MLFLFKNASIRNLTNQRYEHYIIALTLKWNWLCEGGHFLSLELILSNNYETVYQNFEEQFLCAEDLYHFIDLIVLFFHCLDIWHYCS